MSDSKNKPGEGGLPQDAFRKRPFTDEDAYFAEQERINLERLKKERAQRDGSKRHCLSCEDQPLETVEVDKVEIDRCPQCGGVWLDPGELDLLMNRAQKSKSGLTKFFYNLAGRYDE